VRPLTGDTEATWQRRGRVDARSPTAVAGPFRGQPGTSLRSSERILPFDCRFDASSKTETIMTRVKITRKDGSPTPYFWTNKDGSDRSSLTVYKQTSDGIKRMRGVRFDSVNKRMLKH
jgi:hypothetical protein